MATHSLKAKIKLGQLVTNLKDQQATMQSKQINNNKYSSSNNSSSKRL
jgi:hypothetical protein